MPGTASEAVSPVCLQVRSRTGRAAAISASGPAALPSSMVVSPIEYRPVDSSTATSPRACRVFSSRQAVARLSPQVRASAGAVAASGCAAATARRRSTARSTDWIRTDAAGSRSCVSTMQHPDHPLDGPRELCLGSHYSEGVRIMRQPGFSRVEVTPRPARRDVLKFGLVTAAGLAGCSAVPQRPPPGTPPVRGGVYSHGATGGGLKDTLEPYFPVTNPDISRCLQLYEPLLRWDENYEIEPSVAESVTPNADNTQWTVRIRDGVEFHHGKTVT